MRCTVEGFAVPRAAEVRVSLRLEAQGELRREEAVVSTSFARCCVSHSVALSPVQEHPEQRKNAKSLARDLTKTLTFLSSSVISSTLSALMPPSPPPTEVPSIEGSGASPFKGARYPLRSSVSEVAEVDGELGSEPVGEESSEANDMARVVSES